MRKALLIATVLGCACRSKGTHTGGLIADVHLVNQPKVTCADVRVRDADGNELGQLQAAFTGSETVAPVAIGSQGFPADVVISVQPQWSTDGCTGARPNGAAVEHPGHFTAGKVETIRFDLVAPSSALDGDGDGFVGLTVGGPDCDDLDKLAFPGATESCTTLLDLDCDGASGCADTQCGTGCAQPADRLAFITTATPVITATCSAALTVESRNAANAPTNLAAGAIVSFSAAPPAGVAFFSDAACTSAVSQLTVASAASQHTFYFTGAMAGSIDVTVASAGLAPVTQSQTVLPPAASQLAFANPPRSVGAGGCTMLMEVEARDGAGTPRAVAADVVAMLGVAPAAAVSFHEDSACTNRAVSSVTITAGQMKAPLYVLGLQTGAHTVTATATGLLPGSQVVTVNAGPPARLFFTTSAQGVPVSQCSGAARVRAEDAQGNAVALTAGLTLDLTQTGAGVNQFAFYGDSACAGATITNVPLSAPLGSLATFYFKGTNPNMVTVQAAAAGSGLTAATQLENIGAGNPFALKFTSAIRTVQAGGCSQPVTVEVQDVAGFPRNPPAPVSVDLIGNPDAGFAIFSDALCATPLPLPLVIMGGPTGTFRFSPQHTPTQRIDAVAMSLGSDNQVHTVTAAAAQQLRITTTALMVTAGACSPPLHVDVTDTFGNAVSVTNLPVSLATIAAGVTFFSGTGACTTAMPATVTTSTGFDFRFIGNVAGPVPITVSSAGLSQASQTETVNAGLASALFIPPPARTQVAGACSTQALTVVTRDSAGNTVPTTANLTVNLGASDGGITFYDQALCGNGAVGSVQISSGSSSQSFWFIGRKAGSSTVAATASLFTSATQDETIIAGDPSRVEITTPAPLSLQVNTCSAAPVTFETRDAFGNLAALTGMVTFGIDGGTVVQAYSAAACGTPVQSLTLMSGQSSGSFHVRGSPMGSAGVSVAAPLFTADSLPITLTPGPTQLAYTTSPQTRFAGECSSTVTVQTRDSLNMPINVNASTTVGLTARGGFTFFSDSMCLTPATQLTIPAGQNQASYWFRGITGGSFTLDATSAGLTAASAAVIIIPAVRSGTCTIASGQFTVNCVISPGLMAIDNTFLVFQTLSDLNNDNSGEVLARCHIENQNQITCTRGGNPGGKTIQIFWQTATLPTAVNVQHVKNVACSGVLPNPVPITDTMGTGDVFTLHSNTHNGGNVDDNEHDEVTLTSSTNVNLNHAGAGCTAANTHDLQVVQYSGATVTRGNLLLDAGFTTVDVPAASAVLGRSFLLYSWRTASSGNDLCEREVRGTLPDATTMRFSRANGNASAACSDDAWMGGSWERVTLPVGCSVQAVDVALPSSSGSTAVNFTTAVDPTRTLVFTGSNTWGGQGLGEIDVSNDPDVAHVAAHFTLDGGNQVIAVRGSTSGAVRYGVWVVELDPH